MLVGDNFTENFTGDFGNFPKRLKQCPQLFVFANLSITIKSNQFAGKKYRVSYFLKKQRNKESKLLLDILQSKKKRKKKKMNNKQTLPNE